MKSYISIIIIIIGVIAFLVTRIVHDPSYNFSLGAIIIIIIGLIWMYFDSKGPDRKFNFRKTDSVDNCTKCKYYNKRSFNGVDTDCKFLYIKVDEFHVCDLYKKIN